MILVFPRINKVYIRTYVHTPFGEREGEGTQRTAPRPLHSLFPKEPKPYFVLAVLLYFLNLLTFNCNRVHVALVVVLDFRNIDYIDTCGIHWKLCLCFKQALPHVQPSSKREGFATVPDVTWQDIGALEDVREELSMAIMVTKDIFLTSFFMYFIRTVLQEIGHRCLEALSVYWL